MNNLDSNKMNNLPPRVREPKESKLGDFIGIFRAIAGLVFLLGFGFTLIYSMTGQTPDPTLVMVLIGFTVLSAAVVTALVIVTFVRYLKRNRRNT